MNDLAPGSLWGQMFTVCSQCPLNIPRNLRVEITKAHCIVQKTEAQEIKWPKGTYLKSDQAKSQSSNTKGYTSTRKGSATR